MRTTVLRFLLACLFVSNGALANADLAKSKNCMTCHAVSNKIVGPSFKDVAAKYAGQSGSEEKLVQKVIKGGAGTWGPVPMPASPHVNEAEAQVLVKWILATK